MDCLVEIYDREQINNILVVLSFRPRKVVIMYDKNDVDINELTLIEKACKLKIKNIVFEYAQIDCESIDCVSNACKKIIHDNPNCYFDITGGSEMSAIGAYLACTSTFTPIFKLDLPKCRLINIYGCKYLEKIFSVPKLSMDVLFASHGASISGYAHPTPTADLDKNILKFCDVVFNDIQGWKDICFYLQMGVSHYNIEYNPMLFVAPKRISVPNGSIQVDDTKFLDIAQELGFITGLHTKNKKISFSFKNSTIKKYMTDFGTWLELYTYLSLKKEKIFDDVRLSVRMYWNVENQTLNDVTNEIDVTFFSGIHPVFVSCKLSEPTSEALQELSVYPNYFGGRYSRCILVTLGTIKKERSYIFRRARDMKIDLIDGKSIKNGEFINKIKEVLNI